MTMAFLGKVFQIHNLQSGQLLMVDYDLFIHCEVRAISANCSKRTHLVKSMMVLLVFVIPTSSSYFPFSISLHHLPCQQSLSISHFLLLTVTVIN